jgi:hypothetical protein
LDQHAEPGGAGPARVQAALARAGGSTSPILVHPAAIQRLLRSCGFRKVELLPAADDADFYYRQSLAIRHGRDPYSAGGDTDWTPSWSRKAYKADALARSDPLFGESLTVTGFKQAAQ